MIFITMVYLKRPGKYDDKFCRIAFIVFRTSGNIKSILLGGLFFFISSQLVPVFCTVKISVNVAAMSAGFQIIRKG